VRTLHQDQNLDVWERIQSIKAKWTTSGFDIVPENLDLREYDSSEDLTVNLKLTTTPCAKSPTTSSGE
jgi:hypothetical protein